MVMSSIPPSPVIHLDNSRTASDFVRRTIEPHNTRDIHLLIQRDTSGEVDKCEYGVQTARILDHLPVSVFKVDSRSAHVKSEFGAGIGQRGGTGFGVVTMLRISGASVIRSLKAPPSEELSGWNKNCIESISAASV